MALLKILPLLAFLSLSGIATASNICSDSEQRLEQAVATYKTEGSAAFMKEVLKNGPLEGDKRSLGQDQGLNQIEQFFGPVQSYSTLSKKRAW